MKKILEKKFVIILFASIVLISFSVKTIFAVWNGTFYEPGETLNPECLPSQTDCDVRPPLTSVNIDDTAYGGSWDGDTTHAPSKNAVFDKLETISSLAIGDSVVGSDSGSILFTEPAGTLSQNSVNFRWDDANLQLQIGPSAGFDGNSQIQLSISNNVDSFSGVYNQNQNAGVSASTDFLVGADNDGVALTGHFGDYGILSSGWSAVSNPSFDGMAPNDIYLYGSGGNLILGTDGGVPGKVIKFFVGGLSVVDQIATITTTGLGVGTVTPGSTLDVKGTLRLSGSSSGYVGFVPQSAAGSTTYILPNADGSNNFVLTTDGNGNLSWSDKTGGTPGTITSINGDSSAAQTINTGAGLNINNTGPTHTLSLDLTYAPTWTGMHTFTNPVHSALFTGGSIGIGTITPTGYLSVTPPQYSTGTASQTLSTITGTGTTFTSAMVGSQLVFANGVSAGTITAFNSPTSLTVSTSQTVTDQAYIISYTGLQVAHNGNVGIGTTTLNSKLSLAGNISTAAWGTDGIGFQSAAATYNDTSSSGTVANVMANSFGIPTFSASSATTYTNAATLYIAGPPAIGANTTFTNPNSLYVATGNVTIGNAPFSTFFNVLNVGGGIGTNAGPIRVQNSGGTVLGGFAGDGSLTAANSLTFGIPTGAETGTVQVPRNVTGLLGTSLTLQSGGAQVASTNQIAGDLILSTGISTGTGTSKIVFKTAPVGVSGTGDNTPVEVMRIDNSGNVGIGTTAPAAGNRLDIDGGNLVFHTDNTFDIGVSGATRPRTGYFGTSVVAPFFTATNTGGNTPQFRGGAGTDGIGFSSSTVTIVVGGVEILRIRPTADFIRADSNAGYGWSSSTTTAAASDTMLKRAGVASAGVYASNGSTLGAWNAATGIFTTSITNPLLIGGTTTTSPLTLRSTSGVGTTGADIIFQTGTNGATEAMRILNNGNVGIGTTGPVSKLEIGSSDLGNGAAGPVITLGRNTNATATGAGSINFQSKAGTAGFVWQDNAGNLRIHTAAPSDANDTAGVVVGTQTSTRDTKQDIHDYTDYGSALSMILDAPLHTFRYIKEVQGYGENSPLAKVRIGYIADEVNPAFMVGNSIDQVSVNGIMIASIKELNQKINDLEISSLITGTGSLASLGQYADAFFNTVVTKVEGSVAYMKGLVVDTLKVGSPTKRTGITLYDEVTGDPYCLSIANGDQKTTSGACGITEPAPEPTPQSGSNEPPDETPPTPPADEPVLEENPDPEEEPAQDPVIEEPAPDPDPEPVDEPAEPISEPALESEP